VLNQGHSINFDKSQLHFQAIVLILGNVLNLKEFKEAVSLRSTRIYVDGDDQRRFFKKWVQSCRLGILGMSFGRGAQVDYT